MTESTLLGLAAAGAPSVAAEPSLAEKVLGARHRATLRRRSGMVALAGALAVAGTIAARSAGQSRYFSEFEPSSSMAPTVRVMEHLIADRTLTATYGDVVAITETNGGDTFTTIRRVIGLPGDLVACPAGPDGRCHGWTRNGTRLQEPYAHDETGVVRQPIQVPPVGVYVLGDDRGLSVDSQQDGPYRLNSIRGVGVQVVAPDGVNRPIFGAPARKGPGSSNVDPAVRPTSVVGRSTTSR